MIGFKDDNIPSPSRLKIVVIVSQSYPAGLYFAPLSVVFFASGPPLVP